MRRRTFFVAYIKFKFMKSDKKRGERLTLLYGPDDKVLLDKKKKIKGTKRG